MSVKLLSVAEVATILGVAPDRVYDLIRSGLHPAVRLGRQVRISEPELVDWVRGGGQSYPGGWRKTAK